MKNERQQHRYDQRGVTLIELLVTMGLLSMFLVVLTTIFTASVDVQSASSSYSAAISDGRYALARLAYDIRRASAITTPAAPGDETNTLTLTIGAATYIYTVQNGRLQLNDGTTADYLTGQGSRLSDVHFQLLANGSGKPSVRYRFTVTGIEDAHNPSVQTYSGTTELRQ